MATTSDTTVKKPAPKRKRVSVSRPKVDPLAVFASTLLYNQMMGGMLGAGSGTQYLGSIPRIARVFPLTNAMIYNRAEQLKKNPIKGGLLSVGKGMFDGAKAGIPLGLLLALGAHAFNEAPKRKYSAPKRKSSAPKSKYSPPGALKKINEPVEQVHEKVHKMAASDYFAPVSEGYSKIRKSDSLIKQANYILTNMIQLLI